MSSPTTHLDSSSHNGSHVPIHLSVLTFNLLCPAYKRCKHTETNQRFREASERTLWEPRIQAILVELRAAAADLVCLQEYWNASQEFRTMFESALEPNYRCVTVSRTGGKDDGIAIFTRISNGATFQLTPLEHRCLKLTGFGNRIGLLVHLRATMNEDMKRDGASKSNGHAEHSSKDEVGQLIASSVAASSNASPSPASSVSASSSWCWREHFRSHLTANPVVAHSTSSGPVDPNVNSFDMLLLVTHLTFPHGFYDAQQRKFEISSLLSQLDTTRTEWKLSDAPVVLCGDFNTSECEKDPVYARIRERGFRSVFHEIHQREPGVSHANHRGECVPVDFIFLLHDQRRTLQPRYATLLPSSASHETWPADFTISDHRPVLAVFDMQLATAAVTEVSSQPSSSSSGPSNARAAL